MSYKTPISMLFIDPNTSETSCTGPCDVILSPAYYWVRRQALPVRYLRDVRKLLPSVFEDILPEGRYSYTAYREESHYLLFAYDDQAILDALSSKGITAKQIRHVYFAQSEFSDIRTPLKIEGDVVLSVSDGIVVRVPAMFAKQSVALNVDGHRNTSHRVPLARFSHIADSRNVRWFGFIGILVALLMGTEWILISQKRHVLEAERVRIVSENALKPTLMQNEAILNDLKRRHDLQVRLREFSALILEVPLRKGEALLHYDLSGEKAVVAYRLKDASRAKAITAALTQKGLKFSQRFVGNDLRLEVTL